MKYPQQVAACPRWTLRALAQPFPMEVKHESMRALNGKALCWKPGLAGPPLLLSGWKDSYCRFYCIEYNDKAQLKSYLTIHTGKRPHLSSLCGRVLDWNGLWSASYTYTLGNETTAAPSVGGSSSAPVLCCGKSFPSSGVLLNHTDLTLDFTLESTYPRVKFAGKVIANVQSGCTQKTAHKGEQTFLTVNNHTSVCA